MSHIHCYSTYPDDIAGCLYERKVPALKVGDTIEFEGKRYDALPTFGKDDVLIVQTDFVGAQVCTLSSLSPCDIEQDERVLVGAGAGGESSV